MSERCADCGREITRRVNGPGWIDEEHLTVCRSVIIDLNGTPVVRSADYHYVEGEQRRHFEAIP